MTALLDQGLRASTTFVEHDSVPWDPFPGHTEQLPGGEFRLKDRPWRLAAQLHDQRDEAATLSPRPDQHGAR